jgi:Fic family protein
VTTVRVSWVDVEPLAETNGVLESVLAPVRSLQRAWKAVVSLNSAAFQEARRRSLRRHAIETGIIERLYDVEWGVTRALVAEGLTADAVARTDGILDEDVLRLIRTQYEALEFLEDVAREGRGLSTSLIRELHVALTRNQPTYTATGPAGLVFEATLHHGDWKQQDNHVIRPDGSILEYTPAEQVAPQMERLVELYHIYRDMDPIVRESWLHHRFVRIHPFEDGNGRVARCLTLLGLLRHDLAPLVVDRRERDRYLQSLDKANLGDLRRLVSFFAELEIVALRSELEQPVAIDLDAGRGALAVLDAGIDRLRELRSATGAQERGERVATLANSVHTRIGNWLQEMATSLEARLRDGVDPRARASVASAAPPDERARYWRRQVIEAANSVDFFANIQSGVWWTRLDLEVFGQTLRYLVFLQKVGPGETGVLTLTTYAEIMSGRYEDDARPDPEVAVVSTPTETVTWAYTDTADSQWESVTHVLDATLASALARFTTALG